MKSLVFLLLVFLPSLAESEYSAPPLTRYYHYDGKPIYLRKSSFRRYVIPQLKNMLKDYERLLKKIDPLHEKTIAIRRGGDELSQVWKKTRFFCLNKFFKQCEKGYKKAYLLGRKIDLIGLDFWAKETPFYSSRKGVESGQMLGLYVDMGEIFQANYWILHYLEEGIAFGGVRKNINRKLVKNIDPLIKDLNFFSNKAMTAFLSKKEKEMFDFVWDNFFSPLNNYVIKGKDKEHLLRHLEDLNIAWHTFHMKTTKGVRKYPSRTKVLFTVMSKRWSNVLKIILRTKKPVGS